MPIVQKTVAIAVIIAVIVLAGIATALHFIGVFKLPTTTTSAPITSTKTTKVVSTYTTSAKSTSATGTSRPSTTTTTEKVVGGCTVYVVYSKFPTESEHKVIEGVIKIIQNDFKRIGFECSNYKLVGREYFINLKLPAYPAVLVNKEVPSRFKDAFVKVGNYWLLKPPVFYYLLRSYGANASIMTFEHKSKAYIVSGSMSFSKFNIGEEYIKGNKSRYLKEFITWTSGTEVISIELATQETFKDLPYYPAIVVIPEDGFNVSKYSPLLIPVGNRYVYSTGWFANSVLPFLERVSNKRLFLEVHRKPDMSGPHIGSPNAPLKILIFEDVYCPFCARFYNETLPKVIKNYVDTGKAEFILKDLVVHMSSMPLQQALVCFYEKTGDNQKYFQVMDELYKLLLSGSRVDMAVLSKVLGMNATKLMHECNATKIISQERAEAEKYGALGTPTFVIWNTKKNVGAVVVGFMNYDEFSKILNELLK